MNEACFPKANRLLCKRDFDRVFEEGVSGASGCLVIYVAGNTVQVPRLGLVVSRKVGSAVVRNRWKRRLREAFRLEKQNLPRGVDVVVIVRSAETQDVEQLRNVLVRTVGRLGRRACSASGSTEP